ncbi:MAG: amino acid transporter [Clostridium sp.]|nr:amino acid transporter [Clostridium sp.]
MKIKYLFQGLLFGLAYVAPIGVQNLFVINSALYKSKLEALRTAMTTVFFDISLALSCFFGVGFLLTKFNMLGNILMGIGSIVIIYIAISLIRSTPDTFKNNIENESFSKVILKCFAVTWLNPQAIIDGTLLLGGIRASLENETSYFFIIGVALASFLWFNVLSGIVSITKNKFNNKVLKFINILCGLIILFYGLKLGYDFILKIL